MGRIAGFLAGLSAKALVALGIGGVAVGGAAAVDVSRNGAEGATGGIIEWFNRAIGEPTARANTGIKFEGFYAFIENIAQLVMNVTGGKVGLGLMNWARKSQGLEPVTANETKSSADNSAATTPTANPGANGIDPTVTNSVTPANAATPTSEFRTATGNPITASNEITLQNLASTEEFDTIGEVGHKAGLVLAGAASETLSIGSSALGHVADFADWAVMGGIEKLTGIDTGYDERNLSASFHDVVMTKVAPKPELVTAWDRVAFGTGQISSYFIPGAAVAGTGAKLAVSAAAGVSTAMVPETP